MTEVKANWVERQRAALMALPKERLVADSLNETLNDLVGRYADFDDDETDPHGHGKRVPYIGWYWRHVDFADGDFRIGHCGEFVGFMENNKWGYVERSLTSEEAARVTEIVCAAYERNGAGGVLSEIIAETKAKLDELWPLLQSFPLNFRGAGVVTRPVLRLVPPPDPHPVADPASPLTAWVLELARAEAMCPGTAALVGRVLDSLDAARKDRAS